MPTVTLDDPAEILAVLHDPRFAVPSPAGGATALGWLREHVARFSDGADHERRRALAVAALEHIDPQALRERARALATPENAGRLAVQVLAEALAASGAVADHVATIAEGYFPGTDAGAGGDDAVAALVQAFGGTADEATAARIGLLVQACDATAGLIATALNHSGEPPVRVLRRVAIKDARGIAQGSTVEMDARTVPFGAGPHACPGRSHALAIADGAVEALR
jgi:hypothetical protein